VTTDSSATTITQEEAVTIDPNVPHVPRVLDYLLGGSANFESDRTAAQYAFANWPGEVGGVDGVRVDIRAARGALQRIVTHLVRDCGIRQFIDIASGLPTADNTHLAARAVSPDCKVVYVDNDPLVVSYAQQLLAAEGGEGTVFLLGDFRDLRDIVDRAAQTLDLTQPVGIILFGMLHFLEDTDNPQQLLDELLDAVPSGSYVAVSHFAKDEQDTAMNDTLEALDRQLGEAVVRRTRAEVAKFFEDMDTLEPGVVGTHEWRPLPGADGPRPLPMWVAVARKR
jgi:O-methyltransferase involved in polyketide biosynthesis